MGGVIVPRGGGADRNLMSDKCTFHSHSPGGKKILGVKPSQGVLDKSLKFLRIRKNSDSS